MKIQDIFEIREMFARANRSEWLSYVTLRLPPREMGELLHEQNVMLWAPDGTLETLSIYGIKVEEKS
jgi:hypothetical protein